MRRREHARRRPRSVRVSVLQFAIGGLIALVVLAVGATVVIRRAGRDEAIRDARTQSRIIASGIVEPVLTDGLLASDPAAIERLDAVVRDQLHPAGVVRLKLWDESGRILYSDEHRLIGAQFELGAHERRILRRGGTDAEVSDLSAPENRFEPPGKLLEVYRPVQTPNGTRVLHETYFPYRAVDAGATRVWHQFAPIAIGALALLALVQLPLAWGMARRMQADQRTREQLLQRAVDASNTERRRIAANLHDGVVQDLTGVSFTIAGALDRLDGTAQPEVTSSLRDAAATTRRGIRDLRTLLVDIYPPNLQAAGLEAALGDLVAGATSDTLTARLDYAPGRALDADEEALVYRTVHEALQNVQSHARAREVDVAVRGDGGPVTVSVRDDGRGFDPATLASQPDGHLGLRLLHDLAEHSGARLTVDATPGRGTDVRLSLGAAR